MYPTFLQATETNTLNEEQLTLSPPAEDKVPGTYRQILRLNGQKVVIQTSNYHTETGIYMYSHSDELLSMLVPVDDWLRRHLEILQRFVVSHTTIPSTLPRSKEGNYLFKPLLERDSIMISLSKWCRIFKFDDSKGAYVRVDKFSQFAKGNFSANIEASHVYIGPHKGGHHFSLSLRVKQIIYNEEKQEPDTQFLNELLAASTEGEVEKEPKRGKKPKKIEECRLKTPKVVAASHGRVKL